MNGSDGCGVTRRDARLASLKATTETLMNVAALVVSAGHAVDPELDRQLRLLGATAGWVEGRLCRWAMGGADDGSAVRAALARALGDVA